MDDDVFFQTSCVIGPPPAVNDKVLVEATFNPTMPFKWNANRVQVISGHNRDAGNNRDAGHRGNNNNNNTNNSAGRQQGSAGVRGDGGYNAVPPPVFAGNDRRPFRDTSGSYGKDSFGSRGRRSRSPRRDRDGRRDRDRDENKEKENSVVASGRGSSKDKDTKRKRSRSRERSRSSRSPRSPARRRPRVVPRYNVQVPKILLQIEEANILELRKRYSNLYIPSDVFTSRPLWSNTFPCHRPFPFPKPVSFHIMHKEVDSVLPNDAVYDPPDASHAFSAKVMLLSVPTMEEIYRRSCALSEDSADARDAFVHPTRLINFCVGLKGKNETMAIGGHWSPSLDGPNPDKDPSVLIKTAIRTCLALTGIDLSPCTTWYRFAEIYYRRAESGHKGRCSGGGSGSSAGGGACGSGSGGTNNSTTSTLTTTTTNTTTTTTTTRSTPPTTTTTNSSSSGSSSNVSSSCGGETGRVETTVLFLPDVWNISPTKLEWDGLHLNYKRLLDKKLTAISGGVLKDESEGDLLEDEEEDDDQDPPRRKDPTHWAAIDTKNLKVVELRAELDARLLNSRGLRSQLIARITKALKSEQEKEEADKAAIQEKMKTDDTLKKEEEDKKKEEEKRKKEEEEKKKEEEEKRRSLEKERAVLEKRHTLPESPMILVHPSRSAKSGKFDATTMSLSVLLDYRQEDNKEHSFEVSLFAELFNEMLMRDFAFRIFRALVEAPDKLKDEEKKKELEKEKKKDEKDDKPKEKKEEVTEKEAEKRRDSDKAEEEEKEESAPKRRRRDKFKTESDQKEEDEEAILDLDFEYEEEEFFKEDSKNEGKEGSKDEDEDKESGGGSSTKDSGKDSSSMERSKGDSKSRDSCKKRSSGDRKDASERKDGSERKEKEKKKMFTHDPYLLLAFVYFDTTRTGYIVDKDLEDIINLLGMNLSRAQLKKLTQKVVSRDQLYYRKLTDAPLEEKDRERPPPPQPAFLEMLARGNKFHLPVFKDEAGGLSARRSSRGGKGDDAPKLREGVVRYEGSLVDVAKLMQQLQRSEKALADTEDKLKVTQKELVSTKEEARRVAERNQRLSREVRVHVATARSTEEELQRSMDDNLKYMTALGQIKDVVRPLVRGLELELNEDIDMKQVSLEPDSKAAVKTEEGQTNGVST